MADLISALHVVEQQLEADMHPVYAAYVAEARDELARYKRLVNDLLGQFAQGYPAASEAEDLLNDHGF